MVSTQISLNCFNSLTFQHTKCEIIGYLISIGHRKQVIFAKRHFASLKSTQHKENIANYFPVSLGRTTTLNQMIYSNKGKFFSKSVHAWPLTPFIPQVEGDEETPISTKSGCREDVEVNLQPANVYEFGQSLNAARCSGNTAVCADLLASTAPEMLPQLLSTQLDGHTVSFLMQALDSHLLEKDPNLVYRHLNHLHTAERFSVRCSPLPV